MKHQKQGVLFTNQVHESLISNIKVTGLTIDSLVLLLKEHLSFINFSDRSILMTHKSDINTVKRRRFVL